MPAASDSKATMRALPSRTRESDRSAVLPPVPLGSGSRRGRVARLGLADLQGLPVDVAAVQSGDRRATFVGAAEFDEAEAFRLAAGALSGDVRRDDLPVGNGEIVELRIGDLFGEISHMQFHWSSWPAGPAGSLARADCNEARHFEGIGG